MLLHHLLRIEILPLIQPIPVDEQILFMQAEHLQVTASFNLLRQFLANLKATGKFSANSTDILIPPKKIGIGLWELQKSEPYSPGMFPIFRKQMIIAGRIHIWNMALEKYETEMALTTEKKIYTMYCDNEEKYYSAGGVEFFTFTSLFH